MESNIVQLGKQYEFSRTSGLNTLEIEDIFYKDIIKTLCINGVLQIDYNMNPISIECSWMLRGVREND